MATFNLRLSGDDRVELLADDLGARDELADDAEFARWLAANDPEGKAEADAPGFGERRVA